MGKKQDHEAQKETEIKVHSVLALVKKQTPLTLKQEKFCNNECVKRFLKSKGHNVKKASKQLINCLSWRESIAVDYLVADEFSAELAEGIAYVAGHDYELRPVMIFQIKQDYQKLHSQKAFTRLVVFTLEVAIQTMSKNTEQFVLLFNASFYRSSPAFMNMLLETLKIIEDYYPGRLHKAFVVDPPSMFFYLWKGMKPFVELSPFISILSSVEFELFNDSHETSLRFDTSKIASKPGSCLSSRFSFTVSQNVDSVKPWYLSLNNTSTSKAGPTNSTQTLLCPIISPLNVRSQSFDRDPRGNISVARKGFFPSTPMLEKTQKIDPSIIRHPTTPNPSFLRSPALFFRKDCQVSPTEKSRNSFLQYLKFYRQPYDEMIYCSKMKAPLNGRIPVTVSQRLRREYISISQRF